MNRADLAWIMHQWEESSRPREGFQDDRSLQGVKQRIMQTMPDVSGPLLDRIVLEDVLSCIRVIRQAHENQQTLGDIEAKLKTGQLEIPTFSDSLGSLTPQKVERRFFDDTIRMALECFRKEGQAAVGMKEDKSSEGLSTQTKDTSSIDSSNDGINNWNQGGASANSSMGGKIDDKAFFEEEMFPDSSETTLSEPKWLSMLSIGEGEGIERGEVTFKRPPGAKKRRKRQGEEEMTTFVHWTLSQPASSSAEASEVTEKPNEEIRKPPEPQWCEREEKQGYCRMSGLSHGTCNAKQREPICTAHITAHKSEEEMMKMEEPHVEELDEQSGEFIKISSDFSKEWSGRFPLDKVIKIEKITCSKRLTDRHKAAYDRLKAKWEVPHDFPQPLLLYHGTSEANIDIICKAGLKMPSNRTWGDQCPRKPNNAETNERTSCPSSCSHCDSPHKWARCHMYGMGIYFAKQPSKADQYFTRPSGSDNKKSRRLLVFSVITGRTYLVHKLIKQDEFHDYVLPPPNHDCIKAVGDPSCRTGFGVLNDEWTIFNPTQTLLKYIITYDCK